MQTPTRINNKLNIVIPVDETSLGTVYVHATPISRATFERFYDVLGATFTALYQKRLNLFSGPKVTSLLLRDTAKELGRWDGPDGIERGLLPEIWRLTNVAVLGDRGWEAIPYHDAVAKKVFDDDDQAEVENAVCFFTVNSAVMPKGQLGTILAGMESLWGVQVTSLSCTEFAAGLPRSTEEEASTVTPLPTAARA